MSFNNRNRSGPAGQYHSVGRSGPDDVADGAVITASLADPQAFGQIFDRHAAVVHRFLTSRAGTGAADDLLSEVFVAAFRSRKTYDTQFGNARPWLLGIAANVLRHHHRSEHRRSVMLSRVDRDCDRTDEDHDDVAAEIVGRSELEGVRHAMLAVDRRYRDVLVLYSAFELSYAEIALALGLRVGTVRSRLARGRSQLRELLARSGQSVTEDDEQRTRSTEPEGTAR
jgi:RNA polymerase sigma factor (sigma-70 family)